MSIRLPQRRNSLFTKIFLGFLIIILLLTLILLFSFNLFKKSVREEIIKYNESNLNHTVTNYDTRIEIIKSLMLNLYYDSKVRVVYQQLQKNNQQDVNYLLVNDIWSELQTKTSDPLLLLDNLILYYKPFSFILDKEGSNQAKAYFSKYVRSEDYSYEFFTQQLNRSHRFTMFPSSNVENEYHMTKKLLPILLRVDPDAYALVAMIDAKRMYEELHQTVDNGFLLFGADGNLLFSSSDFPVADNMNVTHLDFSRSYTIVGSNYYFYSKSATSGFTYLNIVPVNEIAYRSSQLNSTVSLILIAALVFCIAVSLWLSRRLNQPLRQLIQDVVNNQPPRAFKSKITEFEMLQDKISQIITTMNTLEFDLSKKSTLLTNYGLINRIKRIRTKHTELPNEGLWNDAFKLILCKVLPSKTEDTITEERLAHFIKEYMDTYISNLYPQSRTFQMETDEIVTIVFGDFKQELLLASLDLLRQVFDRDADYYTITLCVSATYSKPSQFEKAYQQVQDLFAQRPFTSITAIESEQRTLPAITGFMEAISRKWLTHLNQGNLSECLSILRQILEGANKKQASAEQLHQLASLAAQLMAEQQNRLDLLPALELEIIKAEIYHSFSIDELLQIIDAPLRHLCQIIEARKNEKDEVLDFVTDYLETHFSEDISLDQVAGKINLSPSYLSNYIKQKTSINFSDHLVNVRISNAKELLMDPGLTIKSVAESVGYFNVTSFNRLFKKITGMSPGEYRKQQFYKSEGDSGNR